MQCTEILELWLRLGADTTGMRYGPRPAPVGVALHTGMHCLHGVGPEACLHLVNRWPIGACYVTSMALMGWTVCVNFVQSSERCNLKNDNFSK